METKGRDIGKICMLSTHGYFDPVPELGKTDTGGQVLYVLQVARALVRMGCTVDIYTRWFDRGRKQIDPLPGCPEARVVRIPAGPWEFIPKEEIYDVLPELARNMVEFIRKEGLDYDLFHGHYVDAGIVTLEVARALSRPAFFTAHSLGAWKRERVGGDPEEMDRVFNFSHRIAEELRIFQSVNAQSVTSREELEKLDVLYDFRSPRIEFIPPGVDIDTFRPLGDGETEEETKIPLPRRYIFVVSRIARVKGHDLLLAAFERVLRVVPDIDLVIGGGSENPDDEEREVFAGMRRFIGEHDLHRRVHLVGGIANQELPPYYRKAALYILPARYEPFGMTALEAMACGVPAIITAFSGIQENLADGTDCLIVNPQETEAYAEAIITLLTKREEADRMARTGCETVRRDFSWEAIARRFLAFYERYSHNNAGEEHFRHEKRCGERG